jgi:glycosyltransferase involved in cell wall biosynthesis
MNESRLSVVIPAYNEDTTLGAVVQKVLKLPWRIQTQRR